MFRVLVSDKIAQQGLAPLLADERMEVVQKGIHQVDDLASYDAILVRSGTKVTADVIEKMRGLKIIARAGVGVDNIDVAAATAKGINVVNAPSGNIVSTAEHTFAMLLALVRNIPQGHNSLKKREWNRAAFQGTELKGKTLGIIGFGRVGTELAKRAVAFEMNVLAHSRSITQERAKQFGAKAASLDELLREAHIISVHTALTEQTKGLLDAEALGKTRKGVLIINCARGGIVDETALRQFLESGHVAGAAFDVFAQEPPVDFSIIELDNVIVTPHIAASTKEAQLNVAVIVAEEILNFAQGKPVQNSVNFPQGG